MPQNTTMPPIRTIRVLAGALMGAIVVAGIAVFFAIANVTDPKSIPSWAYLMTVGLGVLATLLISAIGYRVAPLPAGSTPAESRMRSLTAYQTTMILRFALAESVAIAALALTFAVKTDSIALYAVGGGIAFVLMAWHVWPSERVITKVQERLDSAGGRSDLASLLADSPT